MIKYDKFHRNLGFMSTMIILLTLRSLKSKFRAVSPPLIYTVYDTGIEKKRIFDFFPPNNLPNL